ncbi:MAG: helix-turn-helix domain-containing protein [Sulfurifustis sp.]
MKSNTSTLVKPALPYTAVVGRVLQQHREMKGLKQTDLAETLRITQSAYSRIEKGQTPMTITQLGQVAACLGLTPGDVLQRVDQLTMQLRAQGVEVTNQKEPEISAGAILVALGILIALLAATTR